MIHLNGYATARSRSARPRSWPRRPPCFAWFEAVEGAPAPARFDRYRREVTAGIAAASALVAPTRAMMEATVRHHGPHPRARVIANGRDPERFRPAAVKDESIVTIGSPLGSGREHRGALRRRARAALAGACRRQRDRVRRGAAAAPRSRPARSARPRSPRRPARSRRRLRPRPRGHEPFGLSILEAALAGCALVLGRHPRACGSSGVGPRSSSIRVILWICNARSPASRATRGARRARAIGPASARDYSPERMALAYLALYDEVLARPPRSTTTQRPPAFTPPQRLTPTQRPASVAPPPRPSSVSAPRRSALRRRSHSPHTTTTSAGHPAATPAIRKPN